MDAAQLRAQAAVYLKLAREFADKRKAEEALSIALDYFQRARDLEDAQHNPVRSGV